MSSIVFASTGHRPPPPPSRHDGASQNRKQTQTLTRAAPQMFAAGCRAVPLNVVHTIVQPAPQRDPTLATGGAVAAARWVSGTALETGDDLPQGQAVSPIGLEAECSARMQSPPPRPLIRASMMVRTCTQETRGYGESVCCGGRTCQRGRRAPSHRRFRFPSFFYRPPPPPSVLPPPYSPTIFLHAHFSSPALSSYQSAASAPHKCLSG